MAYILGVDIGTSGTKTVLFSEDGTPVASALYDYPLYTPCNGYAEQDPADWWNACVNSIRDVVAKSGVPADEIKGVGLSGQMHGLVMLDKDNKVIRNSIIWCDQRTGKEVVEITEKVGHDRLIAITANPAITGRIVLMLSFTSYMTTWAEPFYYQNAGEIVTTSTPLVSETPASLADLFFGTTGGCIGETCALALLIGGIFLVAVRVISPVTPLCFIGTVFVLSIFSTGSLEGALASVLSGGLLLGAIFMATDYATTPITTKGRIIFGIGCGLVTMLIRSFGSMPEGVSYSILLMNILSPLIDRFTVPKAFGAASEQKGGKK